MTSIEGGTRSHDASADLQTRVAMLGKVGWCGSPSFSPDGSRVAFVSDLNGVPQVWTVAAEGGWPELVTALDDQVEDVSWSPTGEWLAFAVAPGGGLNTQVYLVRPDGTKLLRLTEGGAENNWLGGWTRDGSALLLASNRGGGKGMDAYLAPVLEGGFRPVATNDGIGYLTDVSRGGERAVLWRMRNRGDEDLYLVDLPGGGEVLLTAHEGPCSFGGGIFSPDGRTVYLSSNKDRDLSAFARVEVGEDGAVGAIEVLTERPDGELQDFALSDDGAVAALVWNVAGRSELAFFDLAAGEHRPMGELPAEVVSELTFSKDGRTVALTLSGAASPMDVWLLEAASGAFRQLTHSPHAGVDLDSLVRPELVEFEAHDGLGLSGWLYLPRGAEGPAPVVLSFHGGPEGQERPQFKTTAQALVAAGIGVFAPNVRGSSGFGKEFVNLDNGALG